MIGKITGIVMVLLFCFATTLIAQKSPIPNPILTADSLATGNYKDVLNSFFQLAFDRLTSPDKTLKFTGTPFAVIAKLDTVLLVDTIYKKYRTLRNLNYSFGLRLDSSYRFNGFSAGLKYAIINKRDETVQNAFVKTVLSNAAVKQLFALNNQMVAKIPAMPNPWPLMQEYSNFTMGLISFGALSKPLQDTMLAFAGSSDSTRALFETLMQTPDFNMKRTTDSLYQDMKMNFNKNALWTVGVTDTTLKNQYVFANVVFHTEFIKSINKYSKTKNDLELNIRSQLQLVDDTLKAGRDLGRAVFNFEPGINWVLNTKSIRKSYLELKFSGGYYHLFNRVYANEEQNQLWLNGTIRIRIFNDIWVPFEVKYDPRNGNLFGFINVRANFRALAGAAKQLYK
ncbi:hypothetical protein A4H97_04915 [Niastella yeongjuensis]|uniref:Uncharacterized protein n=1 Tax=Niastella yeongjuensis TaxID=354355 RepID=A0A1V9EL70_9BACT|nr:hypothetical protein [Niastella yeongjuensis]OQP46866.1 hypothetical protein A4H97_04915 [Niastella yeongjuensis]SEN57843.1 hypothetical protein SAMN05660816_01006 [Niastella yeongjuensis]